MEHLESAVRISERLLDVLLGEGRVDLQAALGERWDQTNGDAD